MSDPSETAPTTSGSGSSQDASFSRENGFSAQLAGCLSVAIEDLEAALFGIDPAIFARYLACNHDPVVQLRESRISTPGRLTRT
jgi:hypothetical protein